MLRLTILSGGSLYWRIQQSGPEQYPLKAFPGWALCSPLHVAEGDFAFGKPTVLGKAGEEAFLSTRGLTFALQSSPQADHLDESEVVEEVLRRLRYVSRQFSLPRTYLISSTRDSTSDPVLLDAALGGRKTKVRRHLFETALTDQHLRQVSELKRDHQIPVHAEVVLDALEAHAQSDFRKALLYAAIAVEAFSAATLEAAVVENVALGDVRHRITSIQVDAVTTVTKDPIANLLLEGDSFSRLLHESPLYILGRSLLVDRPDTYRKVLRLYSTRNKIAHLGIQPIDNKYYSATAEGSTEALGAAIDAIEWFGDAGPYVLPDMKFVPIKGGGG